MKKFTFMMTALLCAVVTFAALMGKQSESPFKTLDKAEMVKAQKLIPATKALDRKAMPMRNGVRKAEAELVTPPENATVETYYTTGGKFYAGTQDGWSDATSSMATINVAIDGTDMYIQGLAYWFNEAWVKGTIEGATVTFPNGQLLGSDDYGDEFLVGSDDAETVGDIVFSYDSENGVLTAETVYILESGAADAVSPYCYWVQPVFSLTEPEVVVPEVVEAPEGLETEEYIIKARNYKDDADVNVSVLVGFDGSDVYIQGLCTYIPEAWAKGTLDGATVTFATGQYFGTYANTYDMYLNTILGEDVVFDYDAEAGTFTAQNEFFLVDNDSYYFDSYRGAVIKKVVEKAAMPANPAITALTNGSYGWYITFNVPNVDTEGDGLASSKLSYMIYTDIEGEIAPLTFTPETHTYLTEDMTEIPFGFTEDWDFYDTQIYLNELYSEDWNNIGIQSIYRGGGEENATEIQWFKIKDYATPAGGDFTFDFNAMTDEPTSSNVKHDGDITEDRSITEGDVTLTITPAEEGKTANRFWSTPAGPQLRVYSGTLTFEAPEGMNITQIVFNAAKWNEGNSADSGEFDETTWTGNAQTVVVTIAGNTQINSIVVTIAAAEEPTEELAAALGELIAVAEMVCDDSLAETLAAAKAVYEKQDATAAELTTALETLSDATLPKVTGIVADAKSYLAVFDENAARALANYFQAVEDAIAAKDYAALHTSVDALIEKCDPILGSIIQKVKGYATDIANETLDTDIAALDAAYEAKKYSEVFNALKQFEADFIGVATDYLARVKAMDTTGKNGVEALNNAIAALESKLAEQTPNIMEVGFATRNLVLAVRAFLAANPGTVIPESIIFDFEDGTMQGWTTIDADGDGYTWLLGSAPSINTVNESSYSVYSQSYASSALTPDNFLVSPQMKLDGSISFYACAQDGEWPSEHFAVAVSTAGNTDAADFANVEEWTMTASRMGNPMNASGKFRGPRKTPGAWYKYTVDLSSYEGAEGYVAIRHFDCTDFFYLVVDDIEIVTSEIILADYAITPAEGVVKSLSDFEITFNNYDITVADDATATLTNTTSENTYNTSIDVEDKAVLISFDDEITEPGEYTLSVVGVKTAAGEPIELTFYYTIEKAPEVVVLPEGLVAETWYFSAKASQSNVRNQEVAVAIDGSDIYIQGLNVDYLPEAWVKGTIDAEAGTATFASGQYFGAFEYEGTDYDMFFVGYNSDASEIADVVFDFDAEAGTLTTDTWIVISAYKNQVSYYEYYQGATITRELPETPELVTLPEGVETEEWTIDGTYRDNSSSDNIVRATEVAFDGTDIYVKGIPFWFEDAWMKGTINAETGIATFPTGQFVGEDDYGWEFMLGSDDGETICDIEFAYDAEAKTLTQLTTYIVENGETPDEISAYGSWTDMLIYAGEPVVEEPVEAPEGLETETYVFTASCLENGEEEAEDYSFQTQVGFDGQDVYFKGLSDDTSNLWLKGTLSEDGKTVTIPANQYMGQSTVLWYTFSYYFTAVAEDGETMEDIVLNYDAETSTFTTSQTLVLHDGKRALGEPYQTFTNVVITKMVEYAATPADPSIDDFKLTDTSYPKAYFIIPAEDVDGNPLMTAKLFYTVWYEEGGVQKQFTAVAGENEYSRLPEDMTEIPYDYDDSWDIYRGGATFYFNPADAVATWTKIGIQSIYYGGGERNVSNIVWSDGEVTTGINEVAVKTADSNVIFDLQGRHVAAPAKGLYIKDGKKVVLK